MRVRTTSSYQPVPRAPRRTSSSEGIQRRVLDLYAKQRRLTSLSLLRLPLGIAILLFLCAVITLSWSSGRNGVAVGLRSVASVVGQVAQILETDHPRLHLINPDEENDDEPIDEDMVENEQVFLTRKIPKKKLHPVSHRYPSPRRRSTMPTVPRHPISVQAHRHVSKPAFAARENHSNPISRSSSDIEFLSNINYVTPRSLPDDHVSLNTRLDQPQECTEWRKIARNISAVHPYRKHFTSLDVIDWFLYVSIFDENFHHHAATRHRRPKYLDVAANHARRWSASWFYDRCMGWDGVCAEANPKYLPELSTQRHCHLIPTCLSDMPRSVKFSMTDAYGGVVKEGSQHFGVDGRKHAQSEKFKNQFEGFRELKCTTLKTELSKLQMHKFDFMSLDVEGYEYPILKGIDWSNTVIDIIVTENRTPQVQAFLERVGYVLYKNVLKDYIYVRRDSGYVIKKEWINVMKRMDRQTYIISK